MRRSEFWLLIGSCAIIGISTTTGISGGLSQQVANSAKCTDLHAQCMKKVEAEFPCEGLTEEKCWNKRYLAVKQCNFLNSHCRRGRPVKTIMPIPSGKKKH
jgi:hypothetical protein